MPRIAETDNTYLRTGRPDLNEGIYICPECISMIVTYQAIPLGASQMWEKAVKPGRKDALMERRYDSSTMYVRTSQHQNATAADKIHSVLRQIVVQTS